MEKSPNTRYLKLTVEEFLPKPIEEVTVSIKIDYPDDVKSPMVFKIADIPSR